MTNIVTTNNGKVVANSKDIADKFGKTHRHVLRDIKNLIENLDDDFRESNFGLSSYKSLQNKELPCYELSRDAFSLLAMGFTGKPALQWKIKYIQAFNMMEKELLNGTSVMQSLNEAMRLMQQDKDVASACGKGLNDWKKLRNSHMEKVDKLQNEVQLLLNFK